MEASSAIEQLESRLTTLSSEREEERRRLEEKLRQMEDDLGESTTVAMTTSSLPTSTLLRTFSASLTSTPTQSPAKVCRRRSDVAAADDEDENLLNEVDEEMKRGEKAGPGFFRVLLKPESQHDSRWNNFMQASIALKRLSIKSLLST